MYLTSGHKYRIYVFPKYWQGGSPTYLDPQKGNSFVNYMYTDSGWCSYVDFQLKNGVCVYTDDEWKYTAPYIYTSGAWKQCEVHIYKDGKWKQVNAIDKSLQ